MVTLSPTCLNTQAEIKRRRKSKFGIINWIDSQTTQAEMHSCKRRSLGTNGCGLHPGRVCLLNDVRKTENGVVSPCGGEFTTYAMHGRTASRASLRIAEPQRPDRGQRFRRTERWQSKCRSTASALKLPCKNPVKNVRRKEGLAHREEKKTAKKN